MAKYNQEFLVQYLRDIYVLYVAEEKIIQKCNAVDREWRNKKANPPRYPAKPVRERPSEIKGGSIYLSVLHLLLFWFPITMAFIFLLIGLAELLSAGWESFDWETVGGCLLFFAIPILLDQPIRMKLRRDDKKASDEIKRINDKFEAEMRAYSKRCKEIDSIIENEYANEKAMLSRRSAYWWQEWKKVCALRELVYNVNIIPRQYRDKYAAVYLYDYFESSGENDLGMALNTYVLEQIKERLDRIMDQLSEVILNQYTMMQNQERAMEQAERHRNEMMQRLSRIEANAEERNKYLKMIESNTETLKYFATADYLWRR